MTSVKESSKHWKNYLLNGYKIAKLWEETFLDFPDFKTLIMSKITLTVPDDRESSHQSFQYASSHSPSRGSTQQPVETIEVGFKKSKKYVEEFHNAKRPPAMPSGLVAIHIKSLILEEMDPYVLMGRYDANVYIRVWINNAVKYTSVYQKAKFPCDLVYDELKHFRVIASDEPGDICNHIRFEVVLYDPSKRDVHHIVCNKDIHLYEAMHDLFLVRRLELREFKYQKPCGWLTAEVVFGYGEFGFGFSNQFLDRSIHPKHNIGHSIFFRPEPPENRRDSTNDVMITRHIGHPCFIPFAKHANLDMSDEFGADIEPYCEVTHKNELVEQKLRGRLECVLKEMQQLSSKQERLHFLRNLITERGAHTPVTHTTYRVKAGFMLKHRIAKSASKPRKSLFGFLEKEGHGQHVKAGPDTRRGSKAESIMSDVSEILPVQSSSSGGLAKFGNWVMSTAKRAMSVVSQMGNMGQVFAETETKPEDDMTPEEVQHVEEDRIEYAIDDRRYTWHM